MSLRIFDDEAMYLEINHAKNLDVQVLYPIDSLLSIFIQFTSKSYERYPLY